MLSDLRDFERAVTPHDARGNTGRLPDTQDVVSDVVISSQNTWPTSETRRNLGTADHLAQRLVEHRKGPLPHWATGLSNRSCRGGYAADRSDCSLRAAGVALSPRRVSAASSRKGYRQVPGMISTGWSKQSLVIRQTVARLTPSSWAARFWVTSRCSSLPQTVETGASTCPSIRPFTNLCSATESEESEARTVWKIARLVAFMREEVRRSVRRASRARLRYGVGLPARPVPYSSRRRDCAGAERAGRSLSARPSISRSR